MALCGFTCQHRAAPAAPVPADAGWAAAAASSAALPVASAGSSARLLSTALPGCEADPRLGTVGSKAAAAASMTASMVLVAAKNRSVSSQALKRNDFEITGETNDLPTMQFRITCKYMYRQNSNSRCARRDTADTTWTVQGYR